MFKNMTLLIKENQTKEEVLSTLLDLGYSTESEYWRDWGDVHIVMTDDTGDMQDFPRYVKLEYLDTVNYPVVTLIELKENPCLQ